MTEEAPLPPARFYARGFDGTETPLFHTLQEAIAVAEQAEMAPFTVYQLIPHPVTMRATNTAGEKLGRQFVEKNDGVEA